MDYQGMENPEDSLSEPMEAHLSYLKLINVPTMFDVGCTQSDPQTDCLSMVMMDSITNKVVKQHLSKRGHREAASIEKLRTYMQAIHTNMQVSSAVIQFDDAGPLVIGGNSDDYTLTIDGVALHKRQEKLHIAKISV